MIAPRLVSLVPSITETLCAFGLQERVVGCTSFCTHPLSLRRTATAVGGTKDADPARVCALSPTHVFVNTEENPPELVAVLRSEAAAKGFLVHECFPRTPEEGIALVRELGELLGFASAAGAWAAECDALLAGLHASVAGRAPVRYVYFIWRGPWMVAGDKTYIARMLALAGFENAIVTAEAMPERYPAVDAAGRAFDSPGTVLLFSSEPFPFKDRHAEEFLAQRAASRPGSPEPRWSKVDGRLLSWYGASTRDALRYVGDLRRRVDAMSPASR